MKFYSSVFAIIALIASTFVGANKNGSQKVCDSEQIITPQNNCVSFTVSSGTGCAWMCSYCANQLGTNNYYFTTGVCTYQTGGCTGNPQAGVTYTCCSA